MLPPCNVDGTIRQPIRPNRTMRCWRAASPLRVPASTAMRKPPCAGGWRGGCACTACGICAIRDPGEIVSFVLGTSRQLVIDLRRGQARRDRLLQTYADDVPAADPSSAPALDHARLRDCLERLAERDRSVLVLSFYDERPARSVGTELGLSEANVRVIRHRALQRLRDCVEARTR